MVTVYSNNSGYRKCTNCHAMFLLWWDSATCTVTVSHSPDSEEVSISQIIISSHHNDIVQHAGTHWTAFTVLTHVNDETGAPLASKQRTSCIIWIQKCQRYLQYSYINQIMFYLCAWLPMYNTIYVQCCTPKRLWALQNMCNNWYLRKDSKVAVESAGCCI